MLHDFLEIFCEQALATLIPDSVGVAKKPLEASAIRSTLCIELVAKLLHLPHQRLLGRIAPTVHSAAQQYTALRGVEHPGLVALLHFAERSRPTPAASLALPDPPMDDGTRTVQPNPALRSRASAESGRSRKQDGGVSMGLNDDPALQPLAGAKKPSPTSGYTKPSTEGGYSKPEVRPGRPEFELIGSVEDDALRVMEAEITAKLKALDERLEEEINEPGEHGVTRRDHELANVRVQREAKAERMELEEERRKVLATRRFPVLRAAARPGSPLASPSRRLPPASRRSSPWPPEAFAAPLRSHQGKDARQIRCEAERCQTFSCYFRSE